MSELWLLLVLLGVGIVIAVILYNWWQERKYRKAIEPHFDDSRDDVLTQTASVTAVSNPTLNEDNEGWMSEPRVRGAHKIEPSFLSQPSPAQAEALAPTLVSLPDDETPTLAESLDEPIFELKGETLAKAELELSTQLQENPTQSASRATPLFELNFESDAPQASMPASSPALALEGAESNMTSGADISPMQGIALPSFLHVAMDWVGVIRCAQAVPLSAIAEIQTELSQFMQFTSCWIQTSTHEGWQNLLNVKSNASPTVSSIACALQLADRGGPVDAQTVARFEHMLQTFASQWSGELLWQTAEPLQQAQTIDAFSIAVDKAVEFHLMATQGMFHATKLRGLAEANGLKLSEQGRFDRFNDEGVLEFSIRNLEGKPFSADMLKTAVMTGMTFQLDIPTTPNNLAVFEQMVQLARQFATSLNAEMLDVNRKSIAQPQLAKIRQQLTSISATMQTQGIAPGSQHARRLFS